MTFWAVCGKMEFRDTKFDLHLREVLGIIVWETLCTLRKINLVLASNVVRGFSERDLASTCGGKKREVGINVSLAFLEISNRIL